jgi:Flp pilus assembly protein TadG
MGNPSEIRKQNRTLAQGLRKLRGKWNNGGQSTVEFALGATLALVVTIVGIQFAIVGQAALAVSQGASALARWAAVNPGGLGTYNGSATMPLPTGAENLLSPTITTSSTSGGTTTYDLSVTVASYAGNTTTTTSTPVPAQDRVVISMSYNAASKIVLPSNTLLGISFPTTLSASDSQLYE